MRLITMMSVLFPVVALVQVLVNSRDYRQPAVAVAVWLAVLGAGAWLVPRLRAGGLAAGETAAAIAVAVAAVAATGAVYRAHGDHGSVDLAVLGTVWLLVLVVMGRSTRVWILAALLVFAAQGVMLMREPGLNPLGLSQLAACGYIIATILAAFAALRPTLETHASIAARQASLASRSAAERAAAAAVQQERRGRLAVLEKEALPLVRGIANGTLDPAEADVREKCARHAEVLRHSLTGSAGASALAAALQPALRAAAVRGLPVHVQEIGDPGTQRPVVARAVLATVDAVISALPPHEVLLTVLASGDEVELYLTFREPPRAVPDLTRFGRDVPASACWRACVSVPGSGGGCLEISWRKDGSA
jgi:hypothetical protein